MHPKFRRIVQFAMLCTLPMLLTGCFLRLLFGTVGIRDKDFTTVFVADIGGRFGPTAICRFDPEMSNLVECRYEFTDAFGDPPVTISRISTAQLVSEFGVLGLFIDPLILQVPADADNFVGTIDDGSGPQPIVVTEVSSFNAQPGTEVLAETGQKFVILEFPPAMISELQSSGTLDGPFDFNFEFEFPRPAGADPEPLAVKAMYAGKVEVSGQTFYPPMLPCVTDFADVPAITIPVASSGDDNLMPQILDHLFQNPSLPCDNVVYDFTGAEQPPLTEVALDIKPGSDPNSINCDIPQKVIPVAILTSETFDALTVDDTTVTFEGAAEFHVKRRTGEPIRHEEDVDGDSDLDLVFHFRLGDTDLTCDSTEGTLTGRTFAGVEVQGTDSVRMLDN